MSKAAERFELDKIVEGLRAEARLLDKSNPQSRTAFPENLDLSVDLPSFSSRGPSQLEFRQEYRVAELLQFDDIAFVQNAYRAVLNREADPAGLDTYVAKIRSGELSKQTVLRALSASQEGRIAGVRIKGLDLISDQRLRGPLMPLRPLVRLINRVDNYIHNKDIPSAGEIKAFQHALTDHQNLMVERLTSALNRLGQAQAHRADLEAEVDQLKQELVQLRQQLRAAEIYSVSESHTLSTSRSPATLSSERMEAYYLAFEDACRGTKAAILSSLNVYRELLSNFPAGSTALDLGCGRGEWLELLGNLGWQAHGVDLNQVMVEHCSSRGLNVSQNDALTALHSLEAETLDLVSGFHIIEHLPFDKLFSLVEEAFRVLKPGGKLLFETPNPENVLVGSHTFYHDPTHRNPITPTSIEFLCTYHGFGNPQILRLNPYPESAKIPGHDPLTERVNGHLCGPQDFAIIVEKVVA